MITRSQHHALRAAAATIITGLEVALRDPEPIRTAMIELALRNAKGLLVNLDVLLEGCRHTAQVNSPEDGTLRCYNCGDEVTP